MGFLMGRDGNLSIVRVSILIGVVGLLLVGAGFLSFTMDQQSRRQPLMINLPAGAQEWGLPSELGLGWRRVFFRADGADIDQIARFYDERMLEHYGTRANEPQRESCNRFPPAGNFADYEPGTDKIPFQYTCMFDRSGLNSTQWTQVTIQPGVFNADPVRNSEGAVVIVYEQRWQP